jgi:hypothetical protein
MRLDFLRDVYAAPGPYATVYLDTSAAEDTAKALSLRWRDARERLAVQGAGTATLRSVEDGIGEHRQETGHRGQVLVATERGLVFRGELPEPPSDLSTEDDAYFGPLPNLMPYVRSRRLTVPYVVAEVDHRGAEVVAVGVSGARRRESVRGTDFPVHKSHAAGEGSQQRHDDAVEEVWKRTARETADVVTEQSSRVGAQAILFSGDVRQRTLVPEQLRKGVREHVVDTALSHHDLSEPDAQRQIADAVRKVAENEVTETVGEFERERLRRTAEGWPEVVAALRRGQVRTLLWTIEHGQGGHLWISQEQIGLDKSELTDLGVTEVQRVPAGAAILRALSSTEAEIVFADPADVRLTDGVAALLRFSGASDAEGSPG